jgi:tripartite-type tricarboxylate transporter receptor subunit TctC
MVNDLIAGRITLAFSVANNMVPHIKAGTLKAMAVAQPKRANVVPDVPTLAEAGLPGVDAGIWAGLYAPRGTPKEIVDKLSAAVSHALDSEAVKKVLATQGIDPLHGGPDETENFTAADIEKWVKVLKAAGLTK